MRIFTSTNYNFLRLKANDYLIHPSWEEWLEKTYQLGLDKTDQGKDLLLLSAFNYYVSNNTGYFADIIYDLQNSYMSLEEDDNENNAHAMRVNERRFKNQLAFLGLSYDKTISIAEKLGIAQLCALIVANNRYIMATGVYQDLG